MEEFNNFYFKTLGVFTESVCVRNRRLAPRLNWIIPLFRFMGYYAAWYVLKPMFRDYLPTPFYRVKIKKKDPWRWNR
jgi:hypothetical protein